MQVLTTTPLYSYEMRSGGPFNIYIDSFYGLVFMVEGQRIAPVAPMSRGLQKMHNTPIYTYTLSELEKY